MEDNTVNSLIIGSPAELAHIDQKSTCILTSIKIVLYGPLEQSEEQDWTLIDNPYIAPDITHESRVLQSLWNSWIEAARQLKASSPQPGPSSAASKAGAVLRINFDIFLPGEDQRRRGMTDTERRGFARITTILHSSLKNRNIPVEGIISNANCWCLLYNFEQHLAMPTPAGHQNYPVTRASHAKTEKEFLEAHWHDPEMIGLCGLSYEERKVTPIRPIGHPMRTRLAREHWDDEYWVGPR